LITPENYNPDIYYYDYIYQRVMKIVGWISPDRFNDYAVPKVVWLDSEDMEPRTWKPSFLKPAQPEEIKADRESRYNTHEIEHLTVSIEEDRVYLLTEYDSINMSNEEFEKVMEIYKKGYKTLGGK